MAVDEALKRKRESPEPEGPVKEARIGADPEPEAPNAGVNGTQVSAPLPAAESAPGGQTGSGPEPANETATDTSNHELAQVVKVEQTEKTEPEQKHDWPAIISEREPQLFYQSKTGLCYDVRMRYHSRLNITPAAYVDPHPEDPRRTFRIYKTIAEAGLITDRTLRGTDQLGPYMEKIPVVEAGSDQLLLVHSQAHLDYIASTQTMNTDELVRETDRGDSIYLNNDSYLAAKLSCGGAIESCRAVVEGRVKNALAVIRPPGHHAEPDAPGGFCLFSNVSVAAKVMLRDYPEQVKKIVILDWDIHHGNGTQKAFFDDPRVLYISLHRYEKGTFYPGTKYGGATVVGGGAGEGYNVNIPWDRPGMGDNDYISAMYRVILPICNEYDPDLVIVSSGFDAAHGDTIGGCHVSPNGYGYMTHLLKTLADGKLVVCLEGGYNLDAISNSALAVTKVLLGEPAGRLAISHASDSAIETIEDVIQIQSKYWKSLGPHIPDAEPMSPSSEGDASSGFKSLYEVMRSAELRELTRKYAFSPFPLVAANNQISVYRDQICASPEVYDAEKLLVIFHDTSSVWAYREPTTGLIRPTDSVVANESRRFVDWAVTNGYGVLDISVPNDEFGTSTLPGYLDVQDLATYIWDNGIKYFAAKSIIFLGIGNAYAGMVHLAGHRELRDRCEGLISFLEDVSLKQVIPSFDEGVIDWYYRTSLIFTNLGHKCWDTQVNQKRMRKRFGRIIRTNAKHVHEMINERFTEAIEFIVDV